MVVKLLMLMESLPGLHKIAMNLSGILLSSICNAGIIVLWLRMDFLPFPVIYLHVPHLYNLFC